MYWTEYNFILHTHFCLQQSPYACLLTPALCYSEAISYVWSVAFPCLSFDRICNTWVELNITTPEREDMNSSFLGRIPPLNICVICSQEEDWAQFQSHIRLASSGINQRCRDVIIDFVLMNHNSFKNWISLFDEVPVRSYFCTNIIPISLSMPSLDPGVFSSQKQGLKKKQAWSHGEKISRMSVSC